MDFRLTVEQEALRQRARELADGTFAARAARWDESEEYPWDNVKDLVAAGFKIVMSGVAASGLDESWLGKELTLTEWSKLKVVSARFGIHLAGEGGEYETFVVDAPQFSTLISIIESQKVWDGQSGHLRITKASLS